MLQLSRILCPIDYSAASDKAVRYAIELARRINVKVRFLNIRNLSSGSESDADEDYIPESFSTLLLAENSKGLQADLRVVMGAPSEMIVKHADEWSADLIVMGSHGRSGLSRLVMGSVAESVFRTASMPVLIVRLDGIDKVIAG